MYLQLPSCPQVPPRSRSSSPPPPSPAPPPALTLWPTATHPHSGLRCFPHNPHQIGLQAWASEYFFSVLPGLLCARMQARHSPLFPSGLPASMLPAATDHKNLTLPPSCSGTLEEACPSMPGMAEPSVAWLPTTFQPPYSRSQAQPCLLTLASAVPST